MVEITIYTSQGAITYTVKKTVDDYEKVLTSALANGNVTTVETIEGSNLTIIPLNAVAIEVKELSEKE